MPKVTLIKLEMVVDGRRVVIEFRSKAKIDYLLSDDATTVGYMLRNVRDANAPTTEN